MKQADYIPVVEAAKAGDRDAFTSLVQRFQNLAYGTALAVVRDVHLAHDATQEAFLTAFVRLRTLREPAAFGGWLRSMVVRCALRMLAPRERSPAVEPASDANPADDAVRRERRQTALAAVGELPAELREVVLHFYLRERTQAQVAQYLGVTAAVVNNRLHSAREKLRGRLGAMGDKEIRSSGLPADFVGRIGEIIKVMGPVAEAELSNEAPELFRRVAAQGAELCVIQRLGGNRARCHVVNGAVNKGAGLADVDKQVDAPFSHDALRAVVIAVAGVRPAKRRMVATGIKVVDLLCPLSDDGIVAMFGTHGVGRVVFEREIYRRLAPKGAKLTLAYFAQSAEAGFIQHLLRQDKEFHADSEGGVQTLWLLSEAATDADFARSIDYVDAAIYFDPIRALRGLYPAVDPLRSKTSLSEREFGAEHTRTAADVRALFAQAEELMADPVMLRLASQRAWAGARKREKEFAPNRLKELAPADRLKVQRARKLERYFSQPFFVAEEFNKRPGISVDVATTVADCRAILDGAADDLAEEALNFNGSLAECRATA